jgi:hypothetical protein
LQSGSEYANKVLDEEDIHATRYELLDGGPITRIHTISLSFLKGCLLNDTTSLRKRQQRLKLKYIDEVKRDLILEGKAF